MCTMLLKMNNVHFKYPGEPEVLKGVNFNADLGEVVAIVGPTGCGKTTFLLTAAGLLEPCAGEVLFNDKPLKGQLPMVRREIGLVFQDPDDQIFNPTVYEEIAFAVKQIFPKHLVEGKVMEVAERFGLKNVLNRSPFRLSVGQRRLVTFASIFAYNPILLLLDEPTANLSSKMVEEIVNLIKEYRVGGKCIILTSHDYNFVAKVADRVYAFSEGKLVGGYDVRRLLNDKAFLEIAEMSASQDL